MKLHIALWLLASSCLCYAQDGLTASLQRLANIQGIKEANDVEYLRESSQTLQLWNAATPDYKSSVAHKMALIHFERAKRLAAANDFKTAASELTAEAAMQKEFDGRLEFATKSPDSFFRDLVELQARLAAETGSDPLAGRVGYSFEKDGDGFTAARLELGDDIGGITVPEMGSDEALALVHRLNRQGGKFVATASRWLVVPKGPLPDVLKQATREVVFDSSGKMMVHRLQTPGEPSPKANPSAANNTQAPSLVQPTAPKKAPSTATASATPSEERTSSTPWSIIVVLIVAATGLLWLLVKNRK